MKSSTKKRLVFLSIIISLLASGKAFAQENEFRNVDKIETVDSLLVDKALGAPGFFDLRVYQYITSKTYGSTNENWALVTSRLLEFNSTGIGGEFSMRHMDYSTAMNSTNEGTPNPHYRNLGSGGNVQVGLGYLTSGRGPVLENEMKFENNLNKVSLSTLQDKNPTTKVEDYVKFPNMYKYQTNGITYVWDKSTTMYTPSQVMENRQNIKEHILKYGGVASKIYRADNYFKYRYKTQFNVLGSYKVRHYQGGGSSYTTTHYYYYDIYSAAPGGLAYYCNNKDVTPNHDVVLIGWDDNYDNAVTGAPQKGAYIAVDADYFYKVWYTDTLEGKNPSGYGTNSNAEKKTTNTNYYYIAYDDFYVESNVYGIGQLGYVNYDYIYQYDQLGLSTSIAGNYYGMEVYGANVFTRNVDYAQKINEISVANTESMQYEVYINPKDGDLTQDKLIKVATTDVLSAGYHTIKWDEPLALTGSRFAVVVKYISPTDELSLQRKEARIGVQSPTEKYYEINGSSVTEKTRNIEYWQNASSAPMRSYISDTGDDWTDLYDGANTKNMSICIKAFVTDDPSYVPPVEKVEINKTELTLIKGDVETLTAKVYPDNVKDSKVYWTSENRNIATVDNQGKVTGVAGGETTIIARSSDATVYAECKVKVDVPVDSIVLNQKEVTMLQNETHVLAPIISPEDATVKEVQWSSSNKEVVRVTEDGVLIGLQQGRAIVTALIRDDYGTHTATCTVVLPESLLVDVTEVRLNKNKMTLEKGTRETLTATVFPDDATNKSLVWTSSNKNVAIVNANGRVTGLSAGKATITVTTVNAGETATCEVTVTEPEIISVKGVTLNKTNLAMEKGDAQVLTATLNPTNSTNKNVTWTSNNDNVVVVNQNGKVTAIGEGTAVVTVRTEDGGYTASCNIRVSLPNTNVTGVVLNKTGMTLKKEDEYQLRADVIPYNATNQKVSWSSNATQVATVDQEGKVKAVGAGKATITVTTADGNYKATCVVTVESEVKVTGIKLDRNTVNMKYGRVIELKATIEPENATNKDITWTSNNEEVATVSGGRVYSINPGKATITATTVDGNYKATCEVTVEDITEDELTINTGYGLNDEDKTITNITSGTTVEQIKDNIETNGTITIVDKDGEPLEDGDKVGTGSKVTITKDDEEVEYVVIIQGDINGDGEVTTTDLQQVIDSLIGTTTIDEKYNKAIDLDGDGEITITDISLLRKLILGLY